MLVVFGVEFAGVVVVTMVRLYVGVGVGIEVVLLAVEPFPERVCIKLATLGVNLS